MRDIRIELGELQGVIPQPVDRYPAAALPTVSFAPAPHLSGPDRMGATGWLLLFGALALGILIQAGTYFFMGALSALPFAGGWVGRLGAHLAAQAPVLLVYLAALPLALLNWRYWPRACACLLVGSVLLVVPLLAQAGLTAYIPDSNWDPAEVRRAYELIGWVGLLARSLAFTLVIAAVFVGRKRGDRSSV
jgi:hypothetical protein